MMQKRPEADERLGYQQPDDFVDLEHVHHIAVFHSVLKPTVFES